MTDLFVRLWGHVPEAAQGPLAAVLDSPAPVRHWLTALLVVVVVTCVHLAIPEGDR